MSTSSKQKPLLKTPDPAREESALDRCAHLHHENRGPSIRQKLSSAAAAVAIALLALSFQGCGSSGGPSPLDAPYREGEKAHYMEITATDYTFAAQPNYFYSVDNQVLWSIQANIASSQTDINSRTVFRIDIFKSGLSLPLLNKAFSIEAEGKHEKFPGIFAVFDGKLSTAKKVESGTIVFSPDSVMAEYVSGSFDVTMTDYDSPAAVAPEYFLKGLFSFTMDACGPAE